MTRNAWGHGLATVTDDGRTLDTWYPEPRLGPAAAAAASGLVESKDEARRVSVNIVLTEIDLDAPPADTADAYLRLHLLSHRLVRPHEVNLDGIFAALPNVVWTSAGPCAVDGFRADPHCAAGAGPVAGATASTSSPA